MSNSKKWKLSDGVYLQHILTEFARINVAMQGKSANDLEKDWELEHKVTRSLEIIGEAVSQLSNDTKSKFPELPWKEMKNLRNRVIHQYFEINYHLIYNIVHLKLPALKEQLEDILQQLQDKHVQQEKGVKNDPVSGLMPREEKEKGQGKKM